MSAIDTQQDGKAAPPRSMLPPYLVLRDFLDQTTVAGLLDYALSHQPEYEPTRVSGTRIEPTVRISTSLRELGPYRELLKSKILGLLPTLVQELRVTPFDADRLETELVAHGHGAFYARHIDTQTAAYDNRRHIRALSGVYYFNAEPKAFTGGALRLYAIGTGATNCIDIEPLRNSLLVFPSWAPHEVMPVSCPSRRFIDSRFAINCWVHRKKSVQSR